MILATTKVHVSTRTTDHIKQIKIKTTKQLSKNTSIGTKPHISILTFNVNSLYAPLIRLREAHWIRITQPFAVFKRCISHLMTQAQSKGMSKDL